MADRMKAAMRGSGHSLGGYRQSFPKASMGYTQKRKARQALKRELQRSMTKGA